MQEVCGYQSEELKAGFVWDWYALNQEWSCTGGSQLIVCNSFKLVTYVLQLNWYDISSKEAPIHRVQNIEQKHSITQTEGAIDAQKRQDLLNKPTKREVCK